MSESLEYKWLPISPARKMVMEILHHSCKVPSLPLRRRFNVGKVADCREDLAESISWSAIFFKAFSLVAERQPALRRAYMGFPYPHLYEHPFSVGRFLLERNWKGENIVLGGRISRPEQTSLSALQDRMRYFQHTPIEEIRSFRSWLALGRLPTLLRRPVFSLGLHLSGRIRARNFGTFVMSSLGNMGVEQGHPLCPLTSYFSFGPIDRAGDVTATLVYDHRVLDGRDVARCLVDLEEVMQHEIALELERLPRAKLQRVAGVTASRIRSSTPVSRNSAGS